MAGKKKEINQSGIFQARFIEQHNRKPRTLDELAAEFGAVRQTVSKWMTGESVPDIISLVKIAKFYDVSTDYLLGCSDTMSVDVNVKSAMEYTGLTEEAIERLHRGLNDLSKHGIEKVDAERKECLRAVSSLIASQEFGHMVDRLVEVAQWAYLECALTEVWGQRFESGMLEGKTKADPFSEEEQERIMAELIRALAAEDYHIPRYQLDRWKAKVIGCLRGDWLVGLLDIRESMDHQQFLVTKDIMAYLEKRVGESRQSAKRRFADRQSHGADHGGE